VPQFGSPFKHCSRPRAIDLARQSSRNLLYGKTLAISCSVHHGTPWLVNGVLGDLCTLYVSQKHKGEGQLEHTEEVGLQYPQRATGGGELCTKSLEATVEIGGSWNRMVPASTASLAFALSATHRKGIEDFAGVAQGPQASAPRIVRRGGGG